MTGLKAALDRLAAGDWDGAHALVQDDGSSEAAWIHAHLHRLEGDPGNAAYWYRRAGRPVATGTLDEERDELRAAFGAAAQTGSRSPGGTSTPR